MSLRERKKHWRGLDETEFDRRGYVYLIEEDKTHTIKIGKTKTLDQRLDLFEVDLPFNIDVRIVLKALDYTLLENRLHQYYDAKHEKGEWYNLTKNDLKDIKNAALPSPITSLILDYDKG